MSEEPEIIIRKEGRAGRITLNRPRALNALTWNMVRAISEAMAAWRDDDGVALVIVDAAGEKAFCAGGDIADLYRTGTAGDYDFGRRFWRDEYRMNAAIATYPKPWIAFMQGYTMGGGVGVACHGSHRILCESSRIAMPECGIGLVPDVGGSLLLARAPGRMGEYLGTTGTRMGPGDAIWAGFADHFLPESEWEALKAELIRSGRAEAVAEAAAPAPEAPLAARLEGVNRNFGGETLGDIIRALRHDGSDFARETLEVMGRNSPLSMACTVEIIHRLRGPGANIARALRLEYRFTSRAMEHGDFLEGIRAAIIDKDRNPRWRHPDPESVPALEVTRMLLPLGAEELRLEEELA
ncbi:MAG: enoyl-CoA hydratase/isomerase family protein [Alphaproteobacteria bacterium]|nr:MAG: enoyl-CoA hydratase/isomerase family protein [Alphaproteobacteria bacterium]